MILFTVRLYLTLQLHRTFNKNSSYLQDKPESELRETMVQQMDVFLQAETINFIDNLFKVVETKVKFCISYF